MKILHITAHLGGGVGKAHAALAAAMPLPARETYLLLEEPRDWRYAEEMRQHGKDVIVARDLADVAKYCGSADIVQFEFWNHPKLFECLARPAFPPMRSVFWSHVSGLFRPVIQPAFIAEAGRFVFTSPASLDMPAVRMLADPAREKLAVIGSAFGFENAAGKTASEIPICYLGTVDFVKMHPGFFDAIDGLPDDVAAAIWGWVEPGGEVMAKACAMRHPDRIRFMGQTQDPRAALERSSIFFYPLQPDHYGTAENALIEAMSLGLAPVVLANPAECAIIRQGQTGFIAHTISECVDILHGLLGEPARIAEIGANAKAAATSAFVAKRSSRQFVDLWGGLLSENKRSHDFAAITGRTPLDWYRATQFLPGEETDAVMENGKLSKGTLSHFRSTFPDDPCWIQ